MAVYSGIYSFERNSLNVCPLIKIRGGFNPAIDAGLPINATRFADAFNIGQLFDRMACHNWNLSVEPARS